MKKFYKIQKGLRLLAKIFSFFCMKLIENYLRNFNILAKKNNKKSAPFNFINLIKIKLKNITL